VRKVTAAQIKKDLAGKNVVKIEVKKKGAGATHYVSRGKTMWEQTVKVHHRTEYKGVTLVRRGDVEYHMEGGRWRYVRTRPGGQWYDGLTNPTAAEVKALLEIAGQQAKCYIQVADFNGYHIKNLSCQFAVGDDADRIAAIPQAKGCKAP